MNNNTVAIAYLLLYLQIITVVTAGCVYPYAYFSIECDDTGSVTTGNVDFTATDGSNPEYDVTVTYLWGIKGPNEYEVINRRYEQSITRTYEHDTEGTYIVGVRYVFGNDSGCEGHEAEQLFQIRYERKDCDVLDDYNGGYSSIGNSNGPPVDEVETPMSPEEEEGKDVVVVPATSKPKPEVVVIPATPEPTTPVPTDIKTLPPSLRPSIPPTRIVTSSSSSSPSSPKSDTPVQAIIPELPPWCGNGNCDPGETHMLCPRDCPVEQTIASRPCGNGNCDPGETHILCPRDCVAPTLVPTSAPQSNIGDGDAPIILDEVLSDANENAAPTDNNNNSNQKNTMFIVAGAAGGACGIAVTMILGMILIRRSKKKTKWDGTWNGKTVDSKSGMEIKTTKTATTKGHTQNNSDSNVSDSIEHSGTSGGANYHGQSYFGTINPTDDGDDLSTLGDPYLGDAVQVMLGADQTVGGETLRTELKLYGVRSPTLAGDASRMGNTTVGTGIVFGEDHTLEDMFQPQVGEQTDTHKLITIVAPAGTLGVMFNNPLGNLPIVLAIKENSALRGKLMVGDMLVSVDEVDCQGMTSSLLSTFLNSRSRNPQRVFTLARNSTAVAI